MTKAVQRHLRDRPAGCTCEPQFYRNLMTGESTYIHSGGCLLLGFIEVVPKKTWWHRG